MQDLRQVEECSSCRFVDKNEVANPQSGTSIEYSCRFSPVQFIKLNDVNYGFGFPITQPTYWCGCYQEERRTK